MHALIDEQSIIVTDAGETVLVAATDPVYPAVRGYLVDERGQNFDTVRAMVNTIRVAVKGTLAEAVAVVDGDIDESGEPAYRITHGDPVEEVILATALRLTREDVGMAPLGEFLKRLERNPSQSSRSQLFGWLRAGGFTITRDGLIVGYKSVRNDGLSAHAGREPVTVVRQDGTSETVTGNIPYPVGATVWMPRHLVDDDRDSACSVGLHVGTYDYAQSFSHQMLVVLVDPADVVSVPTDCSAQKMRVCRLRVAAIHDGEQIADAVIDAIRTMPDFEATEAYAGRPENEVRRPTFAVANFISDDGDDSWDDEDSWDSDEDEDEDEDDESSDDEDIIDLDDPDLGLHVFAGTMPAPAVVDIGQQKFDTTDSDEDDVSFFGDFGDYRGLMGHK